MIYSDSEIFFIKMRMQNDKYHKWKQLKSSDQITGKIIVSR